MVNLSMNWLARLKRRIERRQKEHGVIDKREQALFRIGREQFLRLKEKGLSIQIFSL